MPLSGQLDMNTQIVGTSVQTHHFLEVVSVSKQVKV